jgi:hypothetical protein
MAIVQRVNWIDWGKAFAIYLVVLGHLVSNDGIEGRIHDFIYLFHMPFFFFISGLLFKIKENNIRDMFSRIWRSLIIPYIFLNLLSDIFLIPSWILGREWPLENLVYFLTADAGGEPGPTWFLICLAWVWIAFYYLSRFSYRWQCVILIACGVVSWLFPYMLYWRLDTAVMVLPFFAAGYYSKSLLTWHTDKYKMFLITIGLILISLFFSYINGYSNVYLRAFGNFPTLYYLGAFVGIMMLIMISKMFDQWKTNVICVLSSGTIVIMGLHGVVILYLKLIMKRLGIFAFDNYSIGGKVFIGSLSMVVLYFVILLLQRYCSQWIGNRK